MTKSQPAASLQEFGDLLKQAERLLGKLEHMEPLRFDDSAEFRIPLYNQRLKLRTHIRAALGLPDKMDDAQNAVRVARQATEPHE